MFMLVMWDLIAKILHLEISPRIYLLFNNYRDVGTITNKRGMSA